MKEFMKNGDIHLNKTQSLLLLASVIIIALLSFLLGLIINQHDKSLLAETKNKNIIKNASSQIVSEHKSKINISPPASVDEKSVIKETELTFYKTLANSPETKNSMEQENSLVAKKTETTDSSNVQINTEQKKSDDVGAGSKPALTFNETKNKKKTETEPEVLVSTKKPDALKEKITLKEELQPKPAAPAVETQNVVSLRNSEINNSIEKKSGGNLYTVQIASFTAKEEAFNLKNRLEKKGFDSYIMLFLKDGVKWFRVRVGSMGTKLEADDISKRIKDEIKLNSFVTGYER